MDFATPYVLVHDFKANIIIIIRTYSGLQSNFSACKLDSFWTKQTKTKDFGPRVQVLYCNPKKQPFRQICITHVEGIFYPEGQNKSGIR